MMCCYTKLCHPMKIFRKVYQSAWSCENSLTLNQSKCKFMLISCKRNPVVCLTPLLLDGVILESVQSFKYLGVMLTSDLSCMCQWYALELGEFWVLCIISFMVRLPVQCCCSYIYLWSDHMLSMLQSPHLKKDIIIQKFALRMMFGAWGANYDHLLSIANLPILENRRDVSILLYQILDGSWHFQLVCIIFLYDHSLRHHLCMIVLWYCHFVRLTVSGSLLYPPQLLYGIVLIILLSLQSHWLVLRSRVRHCFLVLLSLLFYLVSHYVLAFFS